MSYSASPHESLDLLESTIPDSYSVYEIWGRLIGKIWIFHSAWNYDRALIKILHELKNSTGRTGNRLRKAGISEDQVREVINGLQKYKNLMVEGDMIAADHIVSTLRFLYPPEYVFIKNAWELGLESDEVRNSKLFKFATKSNVIMICGPKGNLVTQIFLEEAGLSWLFDLEKNHSIRTDPAGKTVLTPKVDRNYDLVDDYGVFIRCRNPFTPTKRMYVVAGAYSFGTEGAAALSCSERSATEILRVPINNHLKSIGVEIIVWLKVWKTREIKAKKEPRLDSFSDPKIYYKIVHPQAKNGKWESHKNPSQATAAKNSLRKTELLESIVFLGSRPSTLVAYTFYLSIFVASLCSLMLGVASAPILVILLIPAGLGAAKMFLSVLKPQKSSGSTLH